MIGIITKNRVLKVNEFSFLKEVSKICITGGSGFIGSNLIQSLLKKTSKKIISLDNYSSGSTRNHISSNKVKYVVGDTYEIEKKISKYTKKIHSVFHFGEFARIYQSFEDFDKCYHSNSVGTKAVFKYCLDKKNKGLT